MLASIAAAPETTPASLKKPFYMGLSFQVLLGVAIAIILGYVSPTSAVAMKPLGDAFIRLITMIITLVIFCTLVTGIAGMEDMKKVGRVGGKALLYFEVVSTIALLIGLVVGNVVHPGSGFHVDPAALDARAVAEYTGQAKGQSVTEFLVHIIPSTIVDAFTRGDILQVLFVSLLFGFALSIAGPRCKPLVDVLEGLTRAVFGVVAILMRFAPIGAFGAMAFTIGKYGLASLGPLAKLMATLYITSILFVVVVLGGIARVAGFGILRFLWFLREEILLVLATSSSEPALPNLMAKLEKPRRSGCSDGLHLQCRRHQPVHDSCRAIRGPGDQHSSNAPPAIYDPRRRTAHLQRRKRRARSRLHRARRHHDGHPNHTRRWNGADSRYRSFP